jgi:predicted naringenin-chalcone synthase
MFGTVTTVGLALPGVEATTKHDGSPRPAVIRAVLVFLGLAGAGAK